MGSFAVQLARWTGAYVIGTASAYNSSFLIDLGVNDVIDYKKISFEYRVHVVDVVFDNVGGKTLKRSWQVLRKGAKLVSVASQDLPTTFDKLMHVSKKKEIHMALTQLGLLFIPAGTNLSELEI